MQTDEGKFSEKELLHEKKKVTSVVKRSLLEEKGLSAALKREDLGETAPNDENSCALKRLESEEKVLPAALTREDMAMTAPDETISSELSTLSEEKAMPAALKWEDMEMTAPKKVLIQRCILFLTERMIILL